MPGFFAIAVGPSCLGRLARAACRKRCPLSYLPWGPTGISPRGQKVSTARAGSLPRQAVLWVSLAGTSRRARLVGLSSALVSAACPGTYSGARFTAGSGAEEGEGRPAAKPACAFRNTRLRPLSRASVDRTVQPGSGAICKAVGGGYSGLYGGRQDLSSQAGRGA